MEQECVENLLNAIVLQAVYDWRRSGKYERERIETTLKKNPLLATYNFDFIFEKLKEEEYEAKTRISETRNDDC